MRDLGPKRGEFYICKDFWTRGEKSCTETIVQAGKELEDVEEDKLFVVEIKAVVRRKPGFDVE